MRRKLATIGIGIIIFTIIVNIWLENYNGFVMIIPLLYLINIRKHL